MEASREFWLRETPAPDWLGHLQGLAHTLEQRYLCDEPRRRPTLTLIQGGDDAS